MKKQFVKNVVADIFVFWALYLGIVEGWTPVLNAVVFVIWFVSLSALILTFTWSWAVKRMSAQNLELTRQRYRSRWWKTYDVATDVLLALVLAADGWFVTAAVFAIAHLALKSSLYEWARKEEVSA